ncbi:MAG: glycosyl hydrolase family 28 protein [Ignavibacteriales bacterium]|nr:glycosyl hydrolase family 28 protein [Ignavibacteriales bacterium]
MIQTENKQGSESSMKLMIRIQLAALLLASYSFAQQDSRAFSVVDFGARGDGTTLNTASIQRAVDKCAESGGVVVVPPGIFLTGSIEMKSNVELYLQKGTTILGSSRLSDYTEHRPQLRSYNDSFLRHSLFYAERRTNIAIKGEGVIDGKGEQFKVISKEKPARYKNRPYLIRFVECTEVKIEGIMLQRPACWTQQYLACENLVIHGIRVYSHANKNNDMMDIDGCRNVVISDCVGDTDDDAITLKSTSERITENVTITNCVVSSHCNALKTGTESTGGFRNIVISNIIVKPSEADSVMTGKRGGIAGIALTNVDGGIMDGISISNVIIDGPEVPIFIRLGNRGRVHYEGAPVPPVGTTRNISISDVIAKNAKSTGCSITGIPNHSLENISLRNIRISFAGGASEKSGETPKELEDQYPESTMWGQLPAYGFYVRHVKGLTLSGVDLVYEREDVRPALLLIDVADARISGFSPMISLQAEAAIVLENVNTVMISGSSVKTPTLNFIKLSGGPTGKISVIGNDLTNVKNLCPPVDRLDEILFSSSNRMK